MRVIARSPIHDNNSQVIFIGLFSLLIGAIAGIRLHILWTQNASHIIYTAFLMAYGVLGRL